MSTLTTNRCLFSTSPSMWLVAVSLLLIAPVQSVAQEVSPEPATRFVYPVDRSDDDGSRFWRFRENGQSHGGLNNIKSKPHYGEDWNWGGGSDEMVENKMARAVAHGVVIDRWDDQGPEDDWGDCLLVKHVAPSARPFVAGNGSFYSEVYSFYAHLDGFESNFKVGDLVHQYDRIGRVGDAGGAYPGMAHLHFEMRGVPIGSTGITLDLGQGSAYGWNLLDRISPSEFIENNLYVGTDFFSIWVHPYDGCPSGQECSGEYPFERDGWHGPIGEALDGIAHEYGHGSHFYVNSGDAPGEVTWIPRIPKSGYYKIAQYVPSYDSMYRYAPVMHPTVPVHARAPTSVEYRITSYEEDGGLVESTSVVDLSNHQDQWVYLGSEGSSGGTFYFKANDESARVILASNRGEPGTTVTADTMRFIHIGPRRTGFVDVGSEHWARSYVERLVEVGAVEEGDLRFRPADLISTASFLKMVIEAGCEDFELPDSVDEVDWYVPYVDYAEEQGLGIGCSLGSCLSQPVKRGWAAQLLRQVFPSVKQAHDRVTWWFFGSGEPADSIEACRRVGAMEGEREGGVDPSLSPDFEMPRAHAAKAVAVARDGKEGFE